MNPRSRSSYVPWPATARGSLALGVLLATSACAPRDGTNEAAASAETPGASGSIETIVQADTGFYQDVSWSPDGSRLLVSVLEPGRPNGFTYHIESLGTDGSGLTRLTEGPLDYWTSWSPDGTRIVFASRDDGDTDLYMMPVGGSDRVRLTDDPASDTQPAWSPDGSRIAFVSDRDGRTRLWVIRADGSDPRPIGEPQGEAQNPAWSPDGTRIVYYESPAPGDDRVTVVNADGSGRTRLSPGVWPSWSPDGSRILFGGKDGLYVMRPDGSNPTRLVAGDADFGRYSPDGTGIAYVAKEDGDITLNVMRADGTGRVILLRRPAPRW